LNGSLPKRVVDFRSDWALCCFRYAFAQIKHLLAFAQSKASWGRPMSRFNQLIHMIYVLLKAFLSPGDEQLKDD